MSLLLKQSTARNCVVFMTDGTDNITGKTGLTLTVTLSKNGASFGVISPAVTELTNGFYSLALTTSHTDTLGDFDLYITATGATPLWVSGDVVLDLPGATVSSVTGNVGGNVVGSVGSVTGNVGGSVASVVGNVGGSVASVGAVVSANLTQILGTALTETAGQIAAGFKQFFNIASPTSTMNTITAVTTATNLTTNNDKTGYALSTAGIKAIWDQLTSALTTVGSIGKLIVDSFATALSTAVWTSGRAVALDNLDATISSRASQSSVNNIQNNTTFAGIVQSPMILPTAGSKAYPFYVRLFDEAGAPIDPDTNVMNYTIKDAAGVVVVAQTAMTRTGTGQYTASYTVNSTDTERALYFFFDYAVNSVAFDQVRSTEVQEFESKLDTLVARLTAQRALNLDNLDVTVSSRLAASSYTAPDNTDIAAIKAKTDNLPAAPASTSDVTTVGAAVTALSSKVGTPAGASVSADIAAVKAVDDAIKTQTDQLGFTAGNVNANAQVVSDKTGYALANAQVPVKKNTALSGFQFIMTDSTTHLPLPGLVVSVQISKDGGAFANSTNAAVAIGGGFYKIDLAAADLNADTVGLKLTATNADTRFVTIVTQ